MAPTKIRNIQAYLLLPALALCLLLGGALLWRLMPAEKLAFRELESPPGFRELVLNPRSSASGALLATLPGLPAGLNGDTGKPLTGSICQALFRDPASPFIGPARARLSIAEFFDYRCPYCKTLSKILVDIQKTNPEVRIVYKEWPILSETSKGASRAALAAAKQGRYIAFHTALMRARMLPTKTYIEALADRLGLDINRLSREAAAPDITRALKRNAALAARFGLFGTPALVVGRTLIQGAVTEKQLRKLIELELGAAPSGNC